MIAYVPRNPYVRIAEQELRRALPDTAWVSGFNREPVKGSLRQQECKMVDLNKVMLIGRLGAKPELRKTGAGDAVCNLRVATSYGSQQDGKFERETLWHAVTVFGKQAEHCATYLDKGRLVYVEGTLRPTEWKDKEGTIHHSREVRANLVNFLSSNKPAAGAEEVPAAA